jgi:hypothetical protein
VDLHCAPRQRHRCCRFRRISWVCSKRPFQLARRHSRGRGSRHLFGTQLRQEQRNVVLLAWIRQSPLLVSHWTRQRPYFGTLCGLQPMANKRRNMQEMYGFIRQRSEQLLLLLESKHTAASQLSHSWDDQHGQRLCRSRNFFLERNMYGDSPPMNSPIKRKLFKRCQRRLVRNKDVLFLTSLFHDIIVHVQNGN